MVVGGPPSLAKTPFTKEAPSEFRAVLTSCPVGERAVSSMRGIRWGWRVALMAS
jgi:hypothetical protein